MSGDDLKNLSERIAQNIDKSGDCWNWKGYRDADGYGVFSFRGKRRKAHRVAWEIVSGEIPRGMCVCHRCDNPSCLNPSHLFLGTNQDNTRDKMSKGRYSCLRGERHQNAKLSEFQVREIRRLRGMGLGLSLISERFGVNVSVVSMIANRKRWTHVK